MIVVYLLERYITQFSAYFHFSKYKRPDRFAAIRRVLCPIPGGAPFRHDPVKKYEFYKKEWTKNPPPGEKKRLSLRWKIREFMLRQDIPSLTAANLARRRRSNPDWVPRPYLD